MTMLQETVGNAGHRATPPKAEETNALARALWTSLRKDSRGRCFD